MPLLLSPRLPCRCGNRQRLLQQAVDVVRLCFGAWGTRMSAPRQRHTHTRAWGTEFSPQSDGSRQLRLLHACSRDRPQHPAPCEKSLSGIFGKSPLLFCTRVEYAPGPSACEGRRERTGSGQLAWHGPIRRWWDRRGWPQPLLLRSLPPQHTEQAGPKFGKAARARHPR